ncbi:MAG: response regulator [Anaerolineaceae bacterium]|nr:response regulator [Anaerolineaceae bacterium]
MQPKPTALVIEDDNKLADIFAQALTAAGYTTEINRDGITSMELLLHSTPALIVVDLHLPGVSGEKVLAFIRAESRFKDTRIILATADSQLAEVHREECDLALVKPITYTQLRDFAVRLLEK